MPVTLDPTRREWAEFVRQMTAAPGEDTPRLVFADWAEEAYPESPFGPMVRAGVELAKVYRPQIAPWLLDDPYRVGVFPWQQAYPPMTTFLSGWHRTWPHFPCYEELPESLRREWTWGRGNPHRVVTNWSHWRVWWTTILALGPVYQLVVVGAFPLVDVTRRSYIHLSPADDWFNAKLPPKEREMVFARRDWDDLSPATQSALRMTARERFLKLAWPQVATTRCVRHVEELTAQP